MNLELKQLAEELREVDGVKAVRREGDSTLKIQLFTQEIPGSDAVKIHGNLRSISQQLVNTLNAAKGEHFNRWNWIQKPEKKYQETSLGNQSVTDRKEKGHRPGHYKIVIE